MDIITILSTIVAVAGIVGGATYGLGARLARIEKDVESLKRGVEDNAREINELRRDVSELKTRVDDLTKAFRWQSDVMLSLVEQLDKKGVIEGVEACKLAFKDITSIIGNPLTEEERKRLLELINKDDLTPEEADELVRLARKVLAEHMDKREAWWLAYYAAAKRGETYRKYNKKLTPLLD